MFWKNHNTVIYSSIQYKKEISFSSDLFNRNVKRLELDLKRRGKVLNKMVIEFKLVLPHGSCPLVLPHGSCPGFESDLALSLGYNLVT